jgi:hypothetical protein
LPNLGNALIGDTRWHARRLPTWNHVWKNGAGPVPHQNRKRQAQNGKKSAIEFFAARRGRREQQVFLSALARMPLFPKIHLQHLVAHTGARKAIIVVEPKTSADLPEAMEEFDLPKSTVVSFSAVVPGPGQRGDRFVTT